MQVKASKVRGVIGSSDVSGQLNSQAMVIGEEMEKYLT